MRKLLDGLYGAGLWLAVLAMALTAILVLAQVVGRVLDRVLVIFGADALGLAIPSLTEFGGFLFVAAAFLALPATFRAGGHVRVTLLAGTLAPGRGPARALEGLVLIAAAGLAGFATWHSGAQALDSWSFGTLSYGMVAVPLWLPQGAMTAGLGLFLLSLLDDLLAVARGQIPGYRAAEAERSVTPQARGE